MSYVDTETFECDAQHKWEVEGIREYGIFQPDEDDSWNCPICGKPDQSLSQRVLGDLSTGG